MVLLGERFIIIIQNRLVESYKLLLMEEILHHLIGSLSQVMQDFFHQQYFLECYKKHIIIVKVHPHFLFKVKFPPFQKSSKSHFFL